MRRTTKGAEGINMFLSQILLRWYRSFNTLSLDRVKTDQFGSAIWNKIGAEDFPFIPIELDPKITTVVGANEAGKSHVLSAITKAFRGSAPGSDGRSHDYDKQDVCRYCGFDHLETNHWPQFVVELTAENDAEKKAFLELAGLGQTVEKLWIRIDGSSKDHFASIYKSPADQPAKVLSQADWQKTVKEKLPEVRIIAADKALASEVHVKQLLTMYDNATPGKAYDPVALQDLADKLRGLKIAPGAAVDAASLTEYTSLCSSLDQMTIGPKEHGHLETLLFRDVLQVQKSTLEEIGQLASTNQPYIYRIVSDIQRRIDERLDLSRVWQQDPDLRLLVDFEAGLFYFRITDKTGIKYAFDERSSGLKFFLSYYIQALALERISLKQGMIVLMDEPDGFLSATGQRNLLNVFENLVDDRRTRTRTQLVYTTHSPFLINKNFPHRVRLVRKGDGAEGTQVVDRSAYRRFEPIRSALGIDYADTLFVGSENVVVEGASDQRLLAACIQRFGRNLPIDALLDLNRVVFVTAGGAPRMKRVIARSLGGTDDKMPVVVALFDGDVSGSKAYQEILVEGLLAKQYLFCLDQLGTTNPDVDCPKVLEDLVPVSLLSTATVKYFQTRWNKNMDVATIEGKLKARASGDTLAARLKEIWKEDASLIQNGVEQDEFRAAVVEELCEMLMDEELDKTAVELLRSNIAKVCSALANALSQATAEQSRQVSKKRVAYFVREFRRSYQTKATKANVQRYIELLRGECGGPGPELKQARDKIEALQGELDADATEADAIVDRDKWVTSLQEFAVKPWG